MPERDILSRATRSKRSNNGYHPSRNPRRESFDAPQSDNFYFRNGYGGNFSSNMDLNRWAIERFCGIVGFDGPVHLSAMSQVRTESYESAGDTLIRKDRLAQPLNTGRNNDNPLLRVTSIPQGWDIAINDHELTRQVVEKKSDKPAEDRFISVFNALLRTGLTEAARRELVTGEKHREFRLSALTTLYATAGPFAILGEHFKDLPSIIEYTGIAGFFVMGAYGIANIGSSLMEQRSGSRYFSMRRITDEPEVIFTESFRPPVPVDNLVASKIFMNTKGRSLVRQKTKPQ